MSEPQISFLGELQRLQTRPGDVFVLQTDEKLTSGMSLTIRDYVSRALGEEAKVLVLSDGLKLGVVSGDFWRTIDSAPRDGTSVMLWSDAWAMSWGELQIGHFEGDGEGGGEWVTGEGSCGDNDPDAEMAEDDEVDPDEDFGPTHWMPMLAGPTA